MMKRGWIAMAGCLLVMGVAAFAFSGQKPYRDLQASDILSATVRLTPPDKTIQVTEIEELVACLNEVVIYNQDPSYTEYAGQAAVFTLTMSDGSREEIVAYNPFVVINGIGYRTKYEPCEKLNRYANRLLEQAE